MNLTGYVLRGREVEVHRLPLRSGPPALLWSTTLSEMEPATAGLGESTEMEFSHRSVYARTGFAISCESRGREAVSAVDLGPQPCGARILPSTRVDCSTWFRGFLQYPTNGRRSGSQPQLVSKMPYPTKKPPSRQRTVRSRDAAAVALETVRTDWFAGYG